MKQKITIKESELRNMIYESVREIVNEDNFIDGIKTNLWRVKNVFDKAGKTYTRADNPYTYNKRNFHEVMPSEDSKEYKKITKADDGYETEMVIWAIERLKSYLKGSSNMTTRGLHQLKIVIETAEKYGLEKYFDYASKLFNQVVDKFIIDNKDNQDIQNYCSNYKF